MTQTAQDLYDREVPVTCHSSFETEHTTFRLEDAEATYAIDEVWDGKIAFYEAVRTSDYDFEHLNTLTPGQARELASLLKCAAEVAETHQ